MVERSETIVVNYEQVSRAFPSTEAADESVRLAVDDPVEQTVFLGALAHVQRVLEVDQTDPAVFSAPRDAVTARFQTLAAQYAREADRAAPLPPGGFEVAFDHNDWLGFIKGMPVAWFLGRFRKHRFLPPSDPQTAADRLRIALVSDWATGLYGARPIANAISTDPEGYDYIVHLGDVYWTGTDEEVEERFLQWWPQITDATSRALNGNHEMYSGGGGYFKRILPEFEQSSSVFAIQNRHWLIVGLDTGYDEHDLAKNQAEWLRDLLAKSGERKVILLSHHQLFSNTARTQGFRIQRKLAELLEHKMIFAWYWGHEHIASIYNEHPTWGLFGRCIGHGGMPEFRKKRDPTLATKINGRDFYKLPEVPPNPSCLVLDGPNPNIRGYEEKYLPNGYLTIQIDGSSFVETLRDADGNAIYENQLA
jgi:hypothetical protein